MLRSLPVLIALFAATVSAFSQPAAIADRTKGLKMYDGFFPFYWDEAKGKILLEIPASGREFLYVNALATGVGSNDLGLDRGQIDRERVVKFERSGPKMLLMHMNYSYRALSDNPLERRSVEEAFAKSVLWGFSVEAESGGRVLVDLTSFLMQDAHGIAENLRRNGQGSYRVDDSRSAVYLERTKNFSKNSEFEAWITLTSSTGGALISSVAPSPEAVTVRMHHSFIELPDNGYQPLAFDPRGGFFATMFSDYGSPVSEPLHKRWVARHRLQKRVPGDGPSEAVKPIVYYLDNGTPEPVRSALLDGARWWEQAFEAAGYRNAFRVEMLPDDADPLDVRYNVIQWVHRSTRGWSYGNTVTDPRTGEIIKGHVSLGSLRVRQDYLIFQGLLSPFDKQFDSLAVDPMKEAALARIRQLAAHEVGHTLGLQHNFAASVNRRASVMDYPHPLVTEKDGRLDLSQVYGTGVGAWDKLAIKWGYGDFSTRPDPSSAREAVIEEGIRSGLRFLADSDTRPGPGAHPETHQWDNGTDAVAELDRLMALRKNALNRFSEKSIRDGAPMATLHETLVPLYLMHRYQVEAAVKFIGGQTYAYALRGDGQPGPKPVPSADQKRALEALLRTVSPEALRLPDAVAAIIPPRPPYYNDARELFKGRTGVTFDALAPAAASAEVLFSSLFHPTRLERILQQQSVRGVAFTADQFQETIDRAMLGHDPGNPLDRQLQAEALAVMIQKLFEAAASSQASPAVKGWALSWISSVEAQLNRSARASGPERARLAAWLHHMTVRFEREPQFFARPESQTPPGAPIGSCDW